MLLLMILKELKKTFVNKARFEYCPKLTNSYIKASISYSIETPQRLMFMQLQKFSFVDNTQIRVDAGQQEFSGTPDGGVFVKQPLDWPAGRNSTHIQHIFSCSS